MDGPTADGIKRRACVNCTVGKSKCSPHSPGTCERCHRLGKECVYENIVSKRKRPGSNSRVHLLEKKVEGLVSLLTNPSQQGTISADAALSSPPIAHEATGTPREPYDFPTVSTHSSIPRGSTTSAGSSPAGPRGNDVVDRGLVRMELAQKLVDDFRSMAIQHFPFVVVPAQTTLHSLRTDRPFLFQSIVAAMTVKDCHLQRKLGEEIRTQVFQRVMIGREKSLDLLQGLLVHVAWYQYQLQPQKQQMLLLTQLCVNLTYELGLEKGYKIEDLAISGNSFYDDPLSSNVDASELRALLGTYYLASTFTIKLKKPNIMPHTKYMKQAGQWLAIRREFPTDELIPYLIDTQELSRRIHDTFCFENPNNIDVKAAALTNTIALGFLHELANLEKSIPATTSGNVTLALELPAIRAMIQEVALYDDLWEPPSSVPNTASAPRATLLWESMQSHKELLRGLIAYPNQHAFYLTFSTFSKLCSVLAWLAKLVKLAWEVRGRSGGTEYEASPWAAMVAADTELPSLARQAQQKLNTMAADIVNRSGEPNSMTTFSILVGSVLSGYEKRLQEYRAASQAGVPSVVIPQEHDHLVEQEEMLQPFIPDTMSLDYFGSLMPQFVDQDMGFQLGAFQDMIWDRIVDDSILLP